MDWWLSLSASFILFAALTVSDDRNIGTCKLLIVMLTGWIIIGWVPVLLFKLFG